MGDRVPFNAEDLCAIATSMYAYAIETVLTGTNTGQPKMARAVRDFVTIQWVRSDRVKAAVDSPSQSEGE